jgi:hypothetical protein
MARQNVLDKIVQERKFPELTAEKAKVKIKKIRYFSANKGRKKFFTHK